MKKLRPARYCAKNWSSYDAALRKRGSMFIWVEEKMAWLAPREGRPGRPTVFSNAEIQFCLLINVLFKLPLRQTAGIVANLLRLAGLDWSVPYFNTLCCRQKTLAVQFPHRRVDRPLNLLVPSRDHAAYNPAGQWMVLTIPAVATRPSPSGRPSQ